MVIFSFQEMTAELAFFPFKTPMAAGGARDSLREFETCNLFGPEHIDRHLHFTT
jgi:hypothetical protein